MLSRSFNIGTVRPALKATALGMQEALGLIFYFFFYKALDGSHAHEGA